MKGEKPHLFVITEERKTVQKIGRLSQLRGGRKAPHSFFSPAAPDDPSVSAAAAKTHLKKPAYLRQK